MSRLRTTGPIFPALAVRGHLFLFGLVVIAPMLGVGIILALKFEAAERRNLEQQAQVIAREMAFSVEREINAVQSALRVLATSNALAAGDIEQFAAKARTVVQSIPGSAITVRTADGQQIVNTVLPYGSALPKTSDPVLLEADRAALATRQVVVSNVYVGAAAKVPFVSVETAVDIAGTLHVVNIAVRADRIRQVLLSRKLPGQWWLGVVDASERILARTREPSLVGTSVIPEFAALLTGAEGAWIGRSREGLPVYTAYHRIDRLGWRVFSSIPLADLEHPLRHIWFLIAALAVLGLVISIGAAGLYGRHLVGAFRRLTEKADAVGRSQLIEDAHTGVRELDALGSTLAEASRRLHALTQQRAELYRRLFAAHEEERLRLSRELHDQTGQSVAAVLLELKRLENRDRAPQPERIRRLVRDVDDIGRALHSIAWELRPASISELGLAEALSTLFVRWSEQSGIPVAFHGTDCKVDGLDEAQQTAIYRVVQEALTNIAKHAAGATSVTVTLSRVDAALRLAIEDNGCGFDVDDAVEAGSAVGSRLGIRGMHERLALIGGDLEIESIPGAGTVVFARLPLDACRSAA
jgi:signal transduction histidine kinase